MLTGGIIAEVRCVESVAVKYHEVGVDEVPVRPSLRSNDQISKLGSAQRAMERIIIGVTLGDKQRASWMRELTRVDIIVQKRKGSGLGLVM